MQCAQCKHELSQEDLYCPQCGAKVARSCIHCHAPLSAEDNFCRNCGTPVKPADLITRQLPENAPLPFALDPVDRTTVTPAVPLVTVPQARNQPVNPAIFRQVPVRTLPPIRTASTPASGFMPLATVERPAAAQIAPPIPAAPVAVPAAPGLYRGSAVYQRPVTRPRFTQPVDIYVYKGIFPRFFAAVLDGFILGVPAYILGWVLVYVLSSVAHTEQTAVFGSAFLLVCLVGIIAVGLEAGGGTPGKRILGLRIIDTRGNPPGFERALLRNLARFIDLVPGIYLLGVLLVAASERKQRLGDRLAGTFVVGKE